MRRWDDEAAEQKRCLATLGTLIGTRFGLHAHKCDCGHTWVHDGAVTQTFSDEDYDKAHTCQQCGKGHVSTCLKPTEIAA
jgi:hypothetical protein